MPPFIMQFFFHNSCDRPNPCNSSFVKAILDGCKRVSANFVSSKKRLPICPEHLHALVRRFAGVHASLSDIRDVCPCLVSFAGFLRFNEACNIRWCDIDFTGTYFSLHIRRIKNNQYGSGSTKVVARTGNPTCPFNMLRKYAHLSGDSFNSTEFGFHFLSISPSAQVLSFRTLELENYLLRSLRPLALILSYMVFIPSGSRMLLQPLITIYQVMLLRSMVVGSPRRPKILTVGKIFNNSS